MKLRGLGVCALAVILGCSAPARPPIVPPPAARAPVDTQALEAFFSARFPADAPGIAVLIAKRGETVFARGYGLADLETREPITTRTLFNLGSLSKTFVANAILILQQRGRLSVDDPLSKYFPGFKRPELAAKVRIRHLLTHTSGLPDNREVEAQWQFYLTARDEENWYPITQADALVFEPGARFAYSNPAFNGLALIVEQLAGRKWQAFVRDEILLPAGMTTSTITDGPHPERGVAHGYDRVEGEWRERDYQAAEKTLSDAMTPRLGVILTVRSGADAAHLRLATRPLPAGDTREACCRQRRRWFRPAAFGVSP